MKTNIYFESTAIVPEKRSGIGHATLELLRELDKDEYAENYRVVAFVPFGEGSALKQYKFKNVYIKQLPFPHKVFSLLSRMLYGVPIDIFLGRGIYVFPNYRNFNLLFSKSLTFIHDVAYKIYPEFTEPKNLSYLEKNMPKWLARTDKVITISQNSKKEIIEYLSVSDSMIAVVELGVNPAVFYPRSDEEVNSVKIKNGLGDNDYFLFVGNIEPRKNLVFLIDTYADDKKLKQYTLFLMGGGGWLNSNIEKSIERAVSKGYKVLRNAEYVPDGDIPALMTGASGVLLPSLHEGFGLSIVQAQACGVPIIASDIPVLHEVGGVDAIYFDNKRSESLSQALDMSLKQDHANINIQYTWEMCANKLLSLIDELQR